ncbi:MAG: S8 family serine peptidase [Actinomycetota bacterium]|nr:S8 family serine peptidase [Actinomycetota bacterium]
MERRGRIFQVVAALAAAALLGYLFVRSGPVDRAFQPREVDERFVAGQVLVGFWPGATAAARTAARRSIGAQVLTVLPIARIELLALAPGDEPRATARALSQNEAVAFAEPNFLYRAAALPDDTRFAGQWGLHNRGQSVAGTTGVRDADIDAPGAWPVATGDGIGIAVIDSGVAYDHPDLKARIPGRGQDWVDDDDDAYDLNGHGTHIAGVAAASFRDAFGVAGVAPRATIVPLRVLDPAGVGTADDIASGIARAAELGVSVANVSIAGPASETVLAAIQSAPDLLIVAAAGNSAADVDAAPVYPCAYPSDNVICVAASDGRDGLAGSSNYGATSVDLVAPGKDILSTSPSLQYVLRAGFETDDHGWVSSGEVTWTTGRDSFGSFLNGTTGTVGGTTGPSDRLDLTGARSCDITASATTDLGPTDRFSIETESEGTWTVAASFDASSTGWQTTRAVLPGGRSLGLRFNLQTTAGGSASLDDVAVTCIAGVARAFKIRSGTSMAAPFVAGVAALLLEREPDLSTVGLVARILGSVDRLNGLSGRIASGGRLNARAALSN